jgi:hypothetical protein
MVNKDFFALNRNLDKAKPAVTDIQIVAATLTTVIKNVLNKYRDNGTPVVVAVLNNSIKLFKVGLFTKNRGGNKNNSSSGLNA